MDMWGPLLKCLRITKWQQQSIKVSAGALWSIKTCGTTHEVKPALQWGLGASRAGEGNGCRVSSPPPTRNGAEWCPDLQHLSGGGPWAAVWEPATWALITDVLEAKAKVSNGWTGNLREIKPSSEPPDFKWEQNSDEHHVLKTNAFPILTWVVQVPGLSAKQSWKIAAAILLWVSLTQALISQRRSKPSPTTEIYNKEYFGVRTFNL